MKQCRECGTLSSDDTVFCYICGTRFPENDAEEKNEDSEFSVLGNNKENSISDCISLVQKGGRGCGCS